MCYKCVYAQKSGHERLVSHQISPHIHRFSTLSSSFKNRSLVAHIRNLTYLCAAVVGTFTPIVDQQRHTIVFRKELTYYFSTPIAYIVIGLYLLAVSLFLWVIPGQWNVIESGYAQVDGLFQLSPWLLMLLCPALTMRLFSEERRSGTWLLLRAQPISLWRIVTGKYMAAWLLTIIALLPTAVHYFIVFYMAEPVGNIDGGQFIGSMLGLVLLSATFTGIGLLASTLTQSQLLAFIIGAVANFALFWVTLQSHYRSISRGVIDMRDVLFFLSVTIAAILLSIFIIDRVTKK